MTDSPKLEPLKISCATTDCDNGLHSFRPKPSAEQRPTTCPGCGVQPNVDLDILRRLDPMELDDVEHMLRQEFIRDRYWRREPDDVAIKRVLKRGFDDFIDGLEGYLTGRIGKAASPWDGRQTPWDGHPIAYGQHATATCCRRCMQYWYGIPAGIELDETQLGWACLTVQRYLIRRRRAFETVKEKDSD